MTAATAAALAATKDPVVLVPGDSGAVREFAEQLRDWSRRLGATAYDLKSLSIQSWTGQAACSFTQAFARVPGLWFSASDEIAECGRIFETYAGALDAAQERAQLAIDTFAEGARKKQAASPSSKRRR